MPPTSILAALMAHAGADPARPCVVWGEATIGYGELAAAAAGWAAAYAALGVARGDRVALYLGSGPGFLGAYLGAHAAGAAAVLVNTQYRQVELRHILADSEPRAVVADAEGAARLAELGGDPPVLTADPGQLAPPAAAERGQAGPLATSAPGDLAILAYTSGTTGRAKGAMLTHGALAANSAAVCAAWRWTAADRLLLVLPLFHIHGLGVGVHGTLMAGASLVLRPRFDPAEALADLAGGACTMFFGVPTIYTRLIQEAGGRRQVTEGVRLFVSGSAPLSPQTFADFEALFGQRILERYGMTETGMNTSNPYDGERIPGSVGVPLPGVELRITDPESGRPLPQGEIGMIEVRGPNVFKGYWRMPEKTAAEFRSDGFFVTGDLGHVAARGHVYISGRGRDLIISGGLNVYPAEVEAVIEALPGVAECAVIGVPHADLGEGVLAVVTPRPGATLDEKQMMAALGSELARYKLPKRICVVDELPRNAMGKVQKNVLREQHRTAFAAR